MTYVLALLFITEYFNHNITIMKRKSKISILFWQRKGRGKAEKSPIFCRITITGQRYEIPANVTIHNKNWSTKLQRSTGKTAEDRDANRTLEQLYTFVLDTVARIQQKGYALNIENFRLMFQNKQNEVNTIRSIFEYHKAIEGKNLTYNTMRSYDTTLRHLLNFIRITRKVNDYDITSIDKVFVNEFYAYLQGYRRQDTIKVCHANGAIKNLKRLKKILGIAVDNDWIPKNPVNLTNLHPTKSERGFLTMDEIQAIEKAILSPALSIVRDIFIFACYTGISYIDVAQLTLENITIGIDNSEWLLYHRQKTKQRVAVPILEPALKIIERYTAFHGGKKKAKIFPVPTNQVTNRELKRIAQIAGVRKEVTFHMARHSFATTITLSNGIPIETVSRMLGHASIATTQIYAKIVDKKILDDMSGLRTKFSIEEEKKKQSV